MAIQEYTDEINNVSVTDTKSAIVIDKNNEISDSVTAISTTLVSSEKIVVGTPDEITNYIVDNNLKYAEVPLPSVE